MGYRPFARAAGMVAIGVLVAGGCGGNAAPEPMPAVLLPADTIELPGEPGAVLVHGSFVWVTQPSGLVRVSVARPRVTARIELNMSPFDLVAADGSLWA